MLKTILTSIMLFICFAIAFAQDKEPDRAEVDRLTDSVIAEGKALFRSEWASWHGTDIFFERFKERENQIGGYVSYETADNLINVFYTKGDKPQTMGIITFGKDFNIQNYQLDTVARPLNAIEMDLYTLRAAAFKALHTDTTFKMYLNTDFNVIPFINKGVKRVYILTSPKALRVVALGNDYQLTVDNNNQITSVKRIHNTLISTDTKGQKGMTLMHTHLIGKDEIMSATDICTLMLYEKENDLKQAYVMSKKYVSIWDCEKDTLIVLTKQAWDRINADQKTRHPKQ
ncbi:hypothetical protein [Mucilaginibacter psychrotolerans]|uniref:Uncharacterized protein n=1 Tax=Mucilaginibacter psychrotolerans TaxID=1524096 RepID=A0A4Y8SM24_9SPHI|nr:hypothetical protein [Mucilaginibacter psychrotolerans]TFF40109.1 hypothetical protein E2R66_02325 [Mucilaginibacter psychrotolerans]